MQQTSVRHTLAEDVYALAVGTVCIVIGLLMLRSAGLVMGGVAGLALLGAHVSSWSVGKLMAVITLPFLVFAYFSMGRSFATKTTVLNCCIVAALEMTPNLLRVEVTSAPFAALVGGTMCGMGGLVLARHGAGMGGIGIVALWLQKRHGIKAGRFQGVVDAIILLAALPFLPLASLAWSVAGALAVSAMMTAWHREDRYLGH